LASALLSNLLATSWCHCMQLQLDQRHLHCIPVACNRCLCCSPGMNHHFFSLFSVSSTLWLFGSLNISDSYFTIFINFFALLNYYYYFFFKSTIDTGNPLLSAFFSAFAFGVAFLLNCALVTFWHGIYIRVYYEDIFSFLNEKYEMTNAPGGTAVATQVAINVACDDILPSAAGLCSSRLSIIYMYRLQHSIICSLSLSLFFSR